MLLLESSLFLLSVICAPTFGHVIGGPSFKASSPATEKSHIAMIVESMPSVSEDHIKVLEMTNGSIYDAKAKGKPELFRKLVEKVHAVNTTDFDEHEVTTELHPESTSHSHVYERTAHTKTTVHKTKKVKSTTPMPSSTTMPSTSTMMPSTTTHSRSKRSFSKDEMQSFSEMGKVFTESFKKFNEDAEKAQKYFMGFMKKLDEMSAKHDKLFE